MIFYILCPNKDKRGFKDEKENQSRFNGAYYGIYHDSIYIDRRNSGKSG